MKKFLSMFFMLGLAFNAQAGISGVDGEYKDYKYAIKVSQNQIDTDVQVMNEYQFDRYVNAIKYIECKYNRNNFCEGFSSVESAHSYLKEVGNYDVPENYKADRLALDKKFDEIRPHMDDFGNFTSDPSLDEDRTLATSAQLDKYSKAVAYLKCVYAGEGACYGFSSVEAARKYMHDMRDNYKATGLNASKKRELDGMAEELLPLITVDEAKQYVKYLSQIHMTKYVEEMHDDATLKTTYKMPGEDTLAAAENGKFNDPNLNKDMETSTNIASKKDFAKAVEEEAAYVQPYTSKPNYLVGVEISKQVENNTAYQLKDGGKQVLVVSRQKKEAPGMAMEQELNSTVFLRRYEEFGYDIKIEKQEVVASSKINPEVYSVDKLPVINVEVPATVLNNHDMDSDWENRYSDIEKADALERTIDGNYMIVEYAVDASIRLREKADDLINEAKSSAALSDRQKEKMRKEAENLKKQAAKALEDAEPYYNKLADFTSVDKVRTVRARYASIR